MTTVARPGTDPGAAWWSPWSASGATLTYLALTLVFTWPLATALGRSIPWDMGDPVFNSWILAWSADHLLRLLSGQLDAFAGYWNANIFHYMFASTLHWRRLVNGYSDGFPTSYIVNFAALGSPRHHPDIAWARLRASGTTHAIVHDAGFVGHEGAAVSAWLLDRGAVQVARFDRDVVFAVR